MFNGDRGEELLRRLTGTDDNHFRSALSELVACYVLAKNSGSSLIPDPDGRNGKTLDFRVCAPCGQISVEVKKPLSIRVDDPTFDGSDWTSNFGKRLERALKDANSQFADAEPNVLVVVGLVIDRSMDWDREDFRRELYGTPAMSGPMNRHDKSGREPPEEFIPSGAFMRRQDKTGTLLKSDGRPANRRISAVISLSEYYEEGVTELTPIEREVNHSILVFHNPYCLHPLPNGFPNGWRQFRLSGETMAWTSL